MAGGNAYQNELLARLYVEQHAAALQAANSTLVSPPPAESSISSSPLTPPDAPLTAGNSLLNVFGKQLNNNINSRGGVLPNSSPTSLFGGMSGAEMGLLRPTNSTAISGMLSEFSALSSRPMAVRNQS